MEPRDIWPLFSVEKARVFLHCLWWFPLKKFLLLTSLPVVKEPARRDMIEGHWSKKQRFLKQHRVSWDQGWGRMHTLCFAGPCGPIAICKTVVFWRELLLQWNSFCCGFVWFLGVLFLSPWAGLWRAFSGEQGYICLASHRPQSTWGAVIYQRGDARWAGCPRGESDTWSCWKVLGGGNAMWCKRHFYSSPCMGLARGVWK